MDIININNFTIEDIERILKEKYPENTTFKDGDFVVIVFEGKKYALSVRRGKIWINRVRGKGGYFTALIIVSIIFAIVLVLLKLRITFLTSFIFVGSVELLKMLIAQRPPSKKDRKMERELARVFQIRIKER